MNTAISEIDKYSAEWTAVRHKLHRHPELGYEEHRTAGVVKEHLSAMGLDYEDRIGVTGVVSVITGTAGQSDRAVGLRADMDALPIQEENAFDHRSQVDGKMHGCGHDGHTTMLLAAARYLVENRARFSGRVVLIFQPGEEGHAGARAMIEDGLFRRFPVDAVYAQHNWPSMAPGTIGVNPGPMMAGIDTFTIMIRGVGGHGAHPHQAIDPTIAAGQIITAIQSIVSRSLNPLDSGVISLHGLDAGAPGRLSIVPETVRLDGMAKWYREQVQDILRSRLQTVVQKTAEAFGASAELDYRPLYPPTVNTAAEACRVARIGETLVGADKVVSDMEPSMGSEDFAFMLREKPGAYFRLGQGGQPGCFLHNPRYDFNDEVIPLGAAMLAQIALDDLAGREA